jgi:hypothetical protein
MPTRRRYHGEPTLSGTEIDADDPSARLAINSAVTEVWPAGTAASGNGTPPAIVAHRSD